MTSRTRLPDGGRRSPVGAPGAGHRSWTPVAVIAVPVAVSAALAVRVDAGAGPVAVLDLVLSGIAVIGVSVVLVLARRTVRVTREQARRNHVVARGLEAVAADLRDEVLRLQSDLARLAARVETSHRRSAPGGDER